MYRTLGTGEEGYYQQDLEEYFATEFETKFGLIQKKINNFAKKYKASKEGKENKTSELLIDEESLGFLQEFTKMIFLRSDSFRSEYLPKLFSNSEVSLPTFGSGLSKSEFISIMENGENADTYSTDSEQVAVFSILINCTNKEFVAPQNVFCLHEEGFLFAPISPVSAIVVPPNEVAKKYGNSFDKPSFMTVNDEKFVFKFNYAAFFIEKHINNGFLIAKRQDELEEMKEYVLQQKGNP
jgi:hypothetical protein